MVSRAISVILAGVALGWVAPARADETPVSRAKMRDEVRAYYDDEIRAGMVFVAFGAATAASGAVLLTRDGDFERGLGWSSLIGGSLTALGGGGYALTVLPRADHFKTLFDRDPEKFKTEEAEHIAGTDRRFVLYLSGEIAVALAGIGVATYGFVKDDDLYKGIGIGVATQGLGLFVIDLPGAIRAAEYKDRVRRFNPSLAFSVGGGNRPWGAAIGHRF